MDTHRNERSITSDGILETESFSPKSTDSDDVIFVEDEPDVKLIPKGDV